MFGSRRIALAREALPSVTAWAELVVGADRAPQLASDAVVAAASARGVATLPELARASRDHIASTLARGESRVPNLPPTDGLDPALLAHADAADDVPDKEPTDDARASAAPYLPGNATPEHKEEREHEDQQPSMKNAPGREPEPDRRSPAERLADALDALRPHERLAAVRFYLDGESVNSVAELFGVARTDAVKLLESVTAVLAPIVGEFDLPDFAAEVDEIDVVTR